MSIKSLSRKLLLVSNNIAILLVAIVVILVFYSQNPNFLHDDNIRNIMRSMAFVGILTIGMGMLLIGGEVDLSSGAVAGLSGVLVAMLINTGIPWGWAIVITIAFGASLGLISALLVNVLGFMHFIATLGLMSVYQGVILVITRNVFIPVPNEGFRLIGGTSFGNIVPLPFIIMLVLMIAYTLVLSNTGFGRSVYMCGGNRKSARLVGIKPKKISYFLYINNGALGALAGVIITSQMATASPVAGQTGSIDAITAAVLGGVAFKGGSGGMFGCFIGILLINSFSAGLTFVGFPQYWQIVARGSLLVLALCLDYVISGARSRALEHALRSHN
ncbi:MAG: ABC transporter permease [Oscillospiraceae bacterium]|nr:ABC transporter permease [Oscillospiraceae bacterium]